ncbi:MAG: sigma-70 family RNA polymerase sigma factor [Opitutaceae bacterium]
MPDDIELLGRYAREGSEEAFAELVRQRLGFVYSVALRGVGGDTHLAEDVVQRVFSDLARKAPQLAQRAVLTGWLYRSARFEAIDVVRTERRRRRREQEAEIMPMLHDQTETDWEAIRPTLDQAISELGETDRDALMLRFFEERPFTEIGQRLRLTEDTARKRVERALDKLRMTLARRGVASSSAVLALVLADKSACAMTPAGLAAAVTGAALGGKLAAGGMAGLGALTFMNVSQTIAGITGIVTALAIGFSVQQRNIARDASVGLAQSEEVVAGLRRELRDERRRLVEVRASAPPPVTKATPPPAAATPPAATALLGSPIAEMLPLTQHQNVGRATPEAAFESAIWSAMTSGEEEALADSFVLKGAAKAKAEALWVQLSAEVRNWAGRPEKIIGLHFARETVEGLDRVKVLGVVQTEDPDLVTLHLRTLSLAMENRKPEVQESKKVQMRRVGGEWKLETPEHRVDRILGRDVEAIVAGRNAPL